MRGPQGAQRPVGTRGRVGGALCLSSLEPDRTQAYPVVTMTLLPRLPALVGKIHKRGEIEATICFAHPCEADERRTKSDRQLFTGQDSGQLEAVEWKRTPRVGQIHAKGATVN